MSDFKGVLRTRATTCKAFFVACSVPLLGLSAASAAAASAAATNVAPKIWGWAPRWAVAEQLYSFQPHASDVNRNPLAFSITNKPTWARFDKTTGRLYGTPAASDRRSSSTIVIRVSDGKTSVALPAFTLTVAKPADDTPDAASAVVSWTPPTTNADGTALVNLAGYHIRYGTNRNALDQSVNVSNVGLTKYVIDGLDAGTWYFAVQAYNRAGEESSLSALGKKIVN